MMSIPLKAILLDLDGTLLDTAPDFVFVVNKLRERHGHAPLPFAQIRQTVSDGARGMILGAFPYKDSDPEFEPLRQELLALYSTHLADQTRLFDGMDELLQFLEARGIAWGVVTNKPSVYAEPLMRALQLDQRCAVLLCPDHVQRRKPDPEALLLACKRIGCAPEEAIYIGDHRRDIEAGHNAGMQTIACAFGYIHAEDPCTNWGAEHVVQTARDIIPVLQHRLSEQLTTNN
jgi:N-acetyl-D-muramate 6-phosphate phosphatase